MDNIVIKSTKEEEIDRRTLVKSFSIDGKEVSGEVDVLSLNPLRFLEYELIKRKANINKIVSSNDPWDIEQLMVEYDKYEEIESLLKEIMEYKCHPEKDLQWKEIVGPVPYRVMLDVSDDIMKFGKSEEDIEYDEWVSSKKWQEIARESMQNYRLYMDGTNPNKGESVLEIPKDEPEKRLHLVYKSSHGGYNIKTRGYCDRSLDHYGWRDTHTWD